MSVATVRLISSGVVSRVGVDLKMVTVTPDAVGTVGYVTVYDGESASDPVVITVFSGTGSTRSIVFAEPVVCRGGLYVAFSTNLGECVVQYEPRKK